MKKYINCLCLCSCLIVCGCITEYEATGIDEASDILVVEGVITDDESHIILSRSNYLTTATLGWTSSAYILDARVFVECEDDGSEYRSLPPSNDFPPKYIIMNGKLNPNSRYRLRIEIDEIDFESEDCFTNAWGVISCPTKTYIYNSVFSLPIKTPEIDSVFWTKKDTGEPVVIHVATHSPDNQILYYRWSYREDWETNSVFPMDDYPRYCWNFSNSRGLLIGSAEKTILGRVTDILTEIPPSNLRLSSLYRIIVRQNTISKQAYDYFENITKNAQQTGSIFAPVPSELRGNITCSTDSHRPVIGYIDVSTTTQKIKLISSLDNVYEVLPRPGCIPVEIEILMERYEGKIPNYYIQIPISSQPDPPPPGYVQIYCVDCTFYGTEQKPDDWPNNY